MKKKLFLTTLVSIQCLSGFAQTKEVMFGDFDYDGKITVKDIASLTSIIIGQNTAQRITNAVGTLTIDGSPKSAVLFGDMNVDGKIDSDDLLSLVNVALGKRNPSTLKVVVSTAKNYENPDSYASVKEYMNRLDYPNFKVATAVNANTFNSKGDLYNYAIENFDEVVADNAMKMNQVVNSVTGKMNFTTVTNFVNTATAAGLNVYGHTLAWHSQQPVQWLSSLIADPDPNQGFPYLVDRDFSSSTQALGGWGGTNVTRTVADGVMKISNPSAADNAWDIQTAINDLDLEKGKTYTLVMKAKASVEGQITAGFQNPDGFKGCGDFPAINLTTDWQNVAIECTVTGDNASRFLINHGKFVGDIYIDDFKLFAGNIGDDEAFYAEKTDVIFSLDFSDGEQGMNSWGNESTRTAENGVLVITNPSESANYWNVQAAYDAKTYENGKTYTLKFKAKTDSKSKSTVLRSGFQEKSTYAGCGDFKEVTLTSEWQDFTLSCTVNKDNADRLIFNFGNIKGNIYFDDIELYTIKTDEPTVNTEIIVERDFSTSDQLIGGWGNSSTQTIVDGVLKLSNPSKAQSWEAQAAIDLTSDILKGETYTLKMKVKSEATGDLNAGFQRIDQVNGKTDYVDCGNFSAIPLSSTWTEVKTTCKVTNEGATRFLFSFGDIEGDIYIDDFQLCIETDPNKLSDTEKKERLVGAMRKWINNMMQATGGKVKAWDMINEAISGGGNINGYYDLQHFAGGGGTWDVGGDTFYWQDFLGSEDYGAIVERLAREAYANVEGTNPDDLKLFINDYNLESTWDNNKKLQSLIYWIGVWERGGAKIDGIGTQMHISYFRRESDQKKQEQCITRMFELMAATGKLVRVSELDMGVYDYQFGTKITTETITDADRLAMAKYYEWIIQEYLRIIPKDQQYGICQWCINDAPANSGWRDGEPVGILELSGKRKATYAGWAEGLKSSWTINQ